VPLHSVKSIKSVYFVFTNALQIRYYIIIVDFFLAHLVHVCSYTPRPPASVGPVPCSLYSLYYSLVAIINHAVYKSIISTPSTSASSIRLQICLYSHSNRLLVSLQKDGRANISCSRRWRPPRNAVILYRQPDWDWLTLHLAERQWRSHGGPFPNPLDKT